MAFHSLFCLLSKCFYQLSQMKTNQSKIPAPVSKPIRTFLDWATTFYFARFVHTQCKHHFSSYLFTLYKDNTKFLPCESFSKKYFWHFAPFLHTFRHSLTLDFLLFLTHLPPLYYKCKLRMKVSKYNCNFHFWVINVIMKFSSRQWGYHRTQTVRWPV